MQDDNTHREQASSRLTALGKKFFKLIEFDSEEELILEIRKHPFGLVGIYVMGFVVVFAMMALVVASDQLFDVDGLGELSVLQPFVAVGGGLLAIGALISTAIGAYIYQSNVIFITSEKIAQVVYKNIIDRKISQLSIGDVQDVTVSQSGIFARIFNYGTLVIETAGEQQNYTFSFVPKPYESSQAIVGAHEENLKKYGN